MTFFSFPEEEWISLRTTNIIIERLNKEFKRRTKPMRYLLVRLPVIVSWPLSL
ncbi:MAG: transposase [Deltaproteobacteria bacterium]|nr:transposase [Deltaproteobacteria bacterium]MDL1960782.1 transposase [Deltaproteobacteria bacterium]